MAGTARPTLSGPVTGGSRGWPFGAPSIDVGEWGYDEVEYFLEGVATGYDLAPGTEMARDGRWSAVPSGEAPYKTRMVVYRPRDPGHFNGTVIVHWNNVSAGYDLYSADSLELLEGGFAMAAVTTQRVGVHGHEPNSQGLRAWDPERYGTLSITSDDYSFDIFTQAARAVGPDRPRDGLDPMAGLAVRKLVAQGASQSAGRLATYVNAIQPLEHVFDGFLITLYFGTATPLSVGDYVLDLADPSYDDRRSALRTGANQLRDDGDTRVVVVNSELEAGAVFPVRQPDTDTFRLWEAAGTAHTSRPSQLQRRPRLERDGVAPLGVPEGMNEVSLTPLVDAALHHLQQWVNGDGAPPSQPRIDFSGDPPEVVRDDRGIAMGGIRLPEVEVPLAVHSSIPRGPDVVSWLSGTTEPFPPGTVAALYGDHETYVARFEEAARAAEKSGVLLPRDVERLVAEARDSPVI